MSRDFGLGPYPKWEDAGPQKLAAFVRSPANLEI
jgi:hypothetical protein